MVWYPRHKPKLKENFTGVVYTFIQSAIRSIRLPQIKIAHNNYNTDLDKIENISASA